MTDSIARERGEWVVRDRVDAGLGTRDEPRWDMVVTGMRSAAATSLDRKAIERLEHRQPSSEVDGDAEWHARSEANRFDAVVARLAETRGDTAVAEEHLRRRVEREQDPDSYTQMPVKRDLIRFLCRQGQFEAARVELDSDPISEPASGSVSLVAEVLLAQRDWNELDAVLERADAEQVGQWLVEPFVQQVLADHPDVRERLLQQYPARVSEAVHRIAPITLLLAAEPELSREELTSAWRSSVGDEVTVEPLEIGTREPAWLLSLTPPAERFLVSARKATYSNRHTPLNPRAEATLDQCHWTIDVTPLGDATKLSRQAWQVLESLSGISNIRQSARACYVSAHEPMLWVAASGEALAEQLRWVDRVPVGSHMWSGIYMDSSEPSKDMSRLADQQPSWSAMRHQWASALEAAGGSLMANAEIRFGGVVESVGCEVVDFDRETGEATVRITGGSKLVQWLSPGRVCRIGVMNLSRQ